MTEDTPQSAIRTYLSANGSGTNYIGLDGRVYWQGTREDDMSEQGIPSRYVQEAVEKFGAAVGVALPVEGVSTMCDVPVEWLIAATSLITTQAGRIAAWDATLQGARIHGAKTSGILRFPGSITSEGDYTEGDLPDREEFYGDLHVTTAGTVIQDKDIFGRLTIDAPGVTVRNCYVHGDDVVSVKESIENGDPMYQRAKRALEEIQTFGRVTVDHETDIVVDRGDNGSAHYRSGAHEVVITITGYTR